MPNQCCVPQCKSGYASERSERGTISFHRFPTDKDLYKAWLRKIPRKDFTPSANSRVCSRHFHESDFIKERTDANPQRKLIRGEKVRAILSHTAVPSVFKNLPSYFSFNPQVQRASTSTAAERMAMDVERHEEEIRLFFEEDKIGSLKGLVESLKNYTLPSGFHALEESNRLLMIKVEVCDYVPSIACSMIINEDLSFIATRGDEVVPFYSFTDLKNPRFETCSQVVNSLASLSAEYADVRTHSAFIDKALTAMEACANLELSDDEEMKLHFLIEQMRLLNVPKTSRRYSPSLIATSFSWNAYGPALYKQIRNDNLLTLPSSRYLEKLSQKVSVSESTRSKDFSYIKVRADRLQDYEKDVILLIDEIYTARRIEFSRGEFIGSVQGIPSNTLLCFMIKSLRGKYQDMVALYPVLSLNSKYLKDSFLEVLEGVSAVGLHVMAVSVDNASSNRSFFVNELCGGELKTSIQHPKNPDDRLYLLFDACHNVKNVYNNFLKREKFVYPNFPSCDSYQSAEFRHIIDLHSLEHGHGLKLAHKLTPTVLNPTSLQRTNMKLCLSVFSDSTATALEFYARESQKPWSETAEFLKTVLKLWNVLNVKSPQKGFHKRNFSMNPIFSIHDWQIQFLRNIAKWLNNWQISKNPGLSRETFLALRHSCLATADLVEHLLNRKIFHYVLTGNFQSDPIESRFGWYRQLSGGNYFISVRQILENEKKIRILSLLKFTQINISEFPFEEEITSSKCEENIEELYSDVSELPILFNLDVTDMNAIVYVAGYISHSICNRMKCENCSHLLKHRECLPHPAFPEDVHNFSTFANMIDRGGLTRPSDFVFCVSNVCFSCFEHLKQCFLERFLTFTNCRQVFVQVVLRKITDDDSLSQLLLLESPCNHSVTFLIKCVVFQFFNCMAKNLCQELNTCRTAATSHASKQVSSQRKIHKFSR
jgi:hypothetical protein